MAFRFDTIIPSPADARDWKYGHTTSNVCAAAPIAPAPTATPPATLDLRPSLYPVRNQGQEGACAGFSSAAMREWQERGGLSVVFRARFHLLEPTGHDADRNVPA